jgi:hypothetical protein
MRRLLVPALPIALVLAACGTDDASSRQSNASVDQEWGPLAVIDGRPNTEEAAADGILTISDVCVTLKHETGRATTLAWPSEATTWNPNTGTISYGDDEITELSDGDRVTFGGGFKDASSNVEWVVERDSSCPGEGAFFVGDVSEGFEIRP